MKKRSKEIGLLVILPLVLTAFSLGFMMEASAEKAEGSPGTVSPKSYGSANDDIVCGDRLCSEPADKTNSFEFAAGS
ncbi:MAG: hypothetical protein ACE5DL_00435 [Nitrosopumilaceae archaeon]